MLAEMTNDYPFKFSIIMSVYNVEEFIREAVDSILEQDMGFEENVQIVFVNDGSTDGSPAICEEYHDRYPNNIIVVHKENGGLSSARNEGAKHVQGRYVNAVDPDDKLSPDTLRKVYNFFIEHDDEIDLVSIPLILFDGMTGDHVLNYKFKKGTRVINLQSCHKDIQLHVASSFIKKEVIQQYLYDTRLVTAEDCKVVLQILMEKFKFGVVSDCKYYYRKRITSNQSLVQSAPKKKEWYLNSLRYFTLFTLNYSKEKFGYIPYFVQFAVLYELKWKLYYPTLPHDILDGNEIAEYWDMVSQAIGMMDDKIILEQKCNLSVKYFMLKTKYNALPSFYNTRENAQLHFQNTNFCWLSDLSTKIEFIRLQDGFLSIDGYVSVMGVTEDTPIEVYISINNELQPARLTKRPIDLTVLDQTMEHRISFQWDTQILESIEKHEIRLYIKINDQLIREKHLSFQKFCPIGNELWHSYFYQNGWVLYHVRERIYVQRCGKRGALVRECKLLRDLLRKNGTAERKAFLARCLYHTVKPFMRRPIWLISDRINKADDNGEAFFIYLNEQHKKEIRSYFVIDRESPDFARLKKTGKVVAHMSFYHKFLYLLCQYNISSQADEYVINPFQRYYTSYRDILYRSRYIFLQHGVTKDDLSDWLNRYNKNMSIFVTTTKAEYDSILQYNYYYSPQNVAMTGFPRHDRLYHNEQKCITIMPTWRKSLMTKLDTLSGIWEHSDDFVNSDYFNFYNALLNNEQLITAAKKAGYTIRFMPHPNVQPHIDLFKRNDEVEFISLNKPYREVFAEADMIVTDYSSVAFDFAYLRKPIIYCQFDKDVVFGGGHIYAPGYYDYERDGFGEVNCGLEDTINCIISYMENGCRLKDFYRERIDNFFTYHDNKNCERVYQAIQALDNKKENQGC